MQKNAEKAMSQKDTKWAAPFPDDALATKQLAHGSMLPLHHTEFRQVKKPIIRDPRMIEQLERKKVQTVTLVVLYLYYT